jgi:hypothetical protein
MSEAQWSKKELVDNVQKTLSTDKDFPIIIDGLTGAGKSTIALQLAKLGCSWFDINSDVIFSRDELIEKISTAKLGSFIVVDEAINLLFKRDFMDKKQKFVLKLLDMCRDRNLCLIMCVPNFWSIDKHILEGRIKLRIHIARTGFAFMWKPTSNPFTPDKWNRKYNESVCYNWDAYPNARKTKGFIGYLKFGDMCDSDKEKYLRIKQIKKEEIRKKEEEEEHKEKIDKEKGFVMGETMVLSLLREQGLLKKGALSLYANMRDINPEALVKRVQRFDKKIVGHDTEDKQSYYNNASNESNLNQTIG